MGLTTKQVLEAIQAALVAMVFPDDYVVPEFVGQNVFERVDVYDVPRLEQAMTDLLNYKNRIALVVPSYERFTNNAEGGILSEVRRQEFVVILSDKDYSPGKPAIFGDAKRAGIINIKEIVLNELRGASFDLPDVVMAPVDGESIRVAENEKNLKKSREGYRYIFETPMGITRTPLQRGRKLRR